MKVFLVNGSKEYRAILKQVGDMAVAGTCSCHWLKQATWGILAGEEHGLQRCGVICAAA
jgi:hypothetical protein